MTLFLIAALVVWGLLLAALERRYPLRPQVRPFGERFRTNFLLALTQLAAAAFVVVPALGIGPAAAAGLGVLLLDASFYLWHRVNHRLTFLWRFHRVHHSDPDLDVTTALRFHFGEVLLSTLLRIAQLLLLGVPATAFLIYAGAFQAAVLFHHSNLRLPARLDRAMSWLIVTPRLHGVHHSQLRTETNSNYSVLTSMWDRLGGSLRHTADDHAVRIGLVDVPAEPDNRPLRALALPFGRARD